MLAAVENMRMISATIFCLIIVAFLGVLLLIVILFLRDRRHEIGIYLTLGEKKRRIIVQFVTEVMTISLIAIVLALLIGHAVSHNLARNILVSNLIAQQSSVEEHTWWEDNPFLGQGYMNPVEAENIVADFDVRSNLLNMMVFLIISLGTTLLATVVPTFFVVRRNPRKIVMC